MILILIEFNLQTKIYKMSHLTISSREEKWGILVLVPAKYFLNWNCWKEKKREATVIFFIALNFVFTYPSTPNYTLHIDYIKRSGSWYLY